jgi:GAF domain-containing protein
MAEADDELTSVLMRLALRLLTEDTLTVDLQRLVQLSERLIGTCSGASIVLLVDGRPTTSAVSDYLAFEMDMLQYRYDDGPCLSSLRGVAVRVDNVATDRRFPRFGMCAADRRVRSVLSVPIDGDRGTIGVLNLYSRFAEGFDSRCEETAAMIAAEAAAAVTKSEYLAFATSVRDEIQEAHDQQLVVSSAAGVIMALEECSAEQAVALIRNAAAANDETLDVAAERILAAALEADDDSELMIDITMEDFGG